MINSIASNCKNKQRTNMSSNKQPHDSGVEKETIPLIPDYDKRESQTNWHKIHNQKFQFQISITFLLRRNGRRVPQFHSWIQPIKNKIRIYHICQNRRRHWTVITRCRQRWMEHRQIHSGSWSQYHSIIRCQNRCFQAYLCTGPSGYRQSTILPVKG